MALDVVLKVPDGDLLPRHVCETCGTIHYQNPKLVVGSVPEYEGRILLCKRGIEPRLGFWTIPGGFMENDETLEEGAAREALEEARIDVEIGSLLLIANVTPRPPGPRVLPVAHAHPGFRRDPREPRSEAASTRRRFPWGDLAFPSTEFALRQFRRGPAPPESTGITWPRCSAASADGAE